MEQSGPTFVDVFKPDPMFGCLAALQGSLLVSPAFFSSGVAVGCAVGFETALQKN